MPKINLVISHTIEAHTPGLTLEAYAQFLSDWDEISYAMGAGVEIESVEDIDFAKVEAVDATSN